MVYHVEYYVVLGAVHSHDPNFLITCGVCGCVRTYKNYHSFRKHLWRDHREKINDSQESEDLTPGVEDQESCDVPTDKQSISQYST